MLDVIPDIQVCEPSTPEAAVVTFSSGSIAERLLTGDAAFVVGLRGVQSCVCLLSESFEYDTHTKVEMDTVLCVCVYLCWQKSASSAAETDLVSPLLEACR